MKWINQEKSNKELERYANEIIKMLEDCNLAEKYKIIDSLFVGLKQTMKDMKMLVGKAEVERT